MAGWLGGQEEKIVLRKLSYILCKIVRYFSAYDYSVSILLAIPAK